MSASKKLYLWKRNHVYYIGYIDGRGKKRWVSSKTNLKSEALTKLAEFKKLPDLKHSVKFLSEFKREFFEFAKMNYAKPTVDIFVVGLRNLQIIAGDCLLNSITPRHVDMYKTERMKSDLPPYYVPTGIIVNSFFRSNWLI